MPKRAPAATQSTPKAPEGRYRIATVAELTGIPEPTLRAWERRYGIPTPERTASGYRLYGEADILLVREMRRLCDEGLAAAEAARLLQERNTAPGVAARVSPSKDGFELAIDDILEAVERFDDIALQRAVRRAVFLGSATNVVERVFIPALRAVGNRWHAGELNVAQEHLASQTLGAVQHELLRLISGGEARPAAILACFADEDHELGLLSFAIRLVELKLRPIFLGARTPPSAVRSAVEAAEPALVALSVTVSPTRARARELIDEYAAACAGVPWLVGGDGAAAIADLVTRRGGEIVSEVGPSFAARLPALLEGTIAGRGAKK
jgi:DNA-binding transcriptional MerR regulator